MPHHFLHTAPVVPLLQMIFPAYVKAVKTTSLGARHSFVTRDADKVREDGTKVYGTLYTWFFREIFSQAVIPPKITTSGIIYAYYRKDKPYLYYMWLRQDLEKKLSDTNREYGATISYCDLIRSGLLLNQEDMNKQVG